MGSYKWGYQSPNKGYKYSYLTYIPSNEVQVRKAFGREGSFMLSECEKCKNATALNLSVQEGSTTTAKPNRDGNIDNT